MVNKNKEKEIIKNLLNLYNDMYKSKKLFNSSYFKYEPEEVEALFKSILYSEDNLTEAKTPKVSESVLSLKTDEEVRNFYNLNLKHNYNSELDRKNCLSKISLNDLKYLYSILYSTPVRSNASKNELLNLIEKYFSRIDRAMVMKP